MGTLAYLAALPLGYFSYRDYQRKDAEAASPAAMGAAHGDQPPPGDASRTDERPTRLN